MTAAVKVGRLHRIRRGYYCSPDAPWPLVHAVRVGGRATATTALPFHGVWAPPDDRIHVLVPDNAARLRQPTHRFIRLDSTDPVHVHWADANPNKPTLLSFSPFVDIRQALIDTVRCCSPEYAAGAIDSALHLRRIQEIDLRAIRAAVGRELHPALDHPNPEADTGSESVVAYRLRALGFDVQMQVPIDGVGRVDLLVNGRLVIEADGRAYHDNGAQFSEDRRRDLALSAKHYLHMRLTYAQIFFDWPNTLAAIRAALG